MAGTLPRHPTAPKARNPPCHLPSSILSVFPCLPPTPANSSSAACARRSPRCRRARRANRPRAHAGRTAPLHPCRRPRGRRVPKADPRLLRQRQLLGLRGSSPASGYGPRRQFRGRRQHPSAIPRVVAFPGIPARLPTPTSLPDRAGDQLGKASPCERAATRGAGDWRRSCGRGSSDARMNCKSPATGEF